MATIVTRAGKGSALSFAEVDGNFTNLNDDKLEKSGGTLTGPLTFAGGQTFPGTGDVTTTGTQTLTNKTLTSPVITAGTFNDGYTEETVTANTGTAYTIALTNGTVQILTLTGNCTFTFPSAAAGQSFMVMLRQDSTGSRTVTWPASVRWPAGTAPTITATASRQDIISFVSDGTSWFGAMGAQNYTF